MQKTSSIFRRSLMVAAVLIASTAALGFSQSMSATKYGHSPESGILVISVLSGSPARQAGLAQGDIILTVNGSAVNNTRDVREAISSHRHGDIISLGVLRGDTPKTLSVALGEMRGSPYLGARFLPDERDRTSMLGPGHVDWSLELSAGAYVSSVSTNSPAYKAGIRKGDVILAVDGVRVDSDHHLSALILDKKIGETVTLSVRSRQEAMDKAPEHVKVALANASDSKRPWLGLEYRMDYPSGLVSRSSSFPLVARVLKDLGILHPHAPTA